MGETTFLTRANTLCTDKGVWLTRRADELELSTRSHNTLQNAGINFVWELVEKSSNQLYRNKNFGPGTVTDIKRALKEVGLKLESRLSRELKLALRITRRGDEPIEDLANPGLTLPSLEELVDQREKGCRGLDLLIQHHAEIEAGLKAYHDP